MDRLAILLATWFGCGRSPKAPGTVGSLAAILIAIILHEFLGFAPAHFVLLALVTFPLAVWSASVTARTLGLKDPQIVVIDEVIGQWVGLAGSHVFTPIVYIQAFVVFRVFDIWKPWPVRQLESLPNGWGINADDLMAGVYTALVLFASGWFNL